MEDRPIYSLPKDIQTRWASAENYDALPGAAGQEQCGRKGMPARPVAAGETFVMAHGEGSGTVCRIWITISDRRPPMLRGLVLRMYWDGEEKPAVEAPIGDFFCHSLGRMAAFENAYFDSPEARSFVCRIPMPFRKGFRITMSNESPNDLRCFFYDVNFTLGEEHDADTGYFHAHYRRENPTVLRQDFEILPRVEGRGRFLGCCLGAIADMAKWSNTWWGEGEVKCFLDGDTDLPTLCGTGTEDYIATGWGQGFYAQQWQGCTVADGEQMQYSFYRFHGPDPVYFHKDIRVTIQQIGCAGKDQMVKFMRENGIESLVACGDGSGRLTADDIEALEHHCFLFERTDDWCATSFFYLDRPSNGLPAIDPYELRIAGLTGDVDPNKRTDV